MNDSFILVLVLAIPALIVLHLVKSRLDRERIRRYLLDQGATLLEKKWMPFGRGWLGEKNARIYRVRYLDRDGHEHEAICKTSMFAGVYFTEDHIVKRADGPPGPPPDSALPPRRPEETAAVVCGECGYNLRGTLAAGGHRCPVCGRYLEMEPR